MTAKALNRIYHHSIDLSFLNGVERLLRRARQLHVTGASRQTVHDYMKIEQAYTLHRPARRRFTRNHTYNVCGGDRRLMAG